MKSVLALGALAALVAAQDDTSKYAACVQTCIGNMLESAKAEELDCNPEEFSCLCQNPNFTYGFRDCAIATCQLEPDEAPKAVEYAVNLCGNNGVVVTDGSGGQVSATGSAASASGSAGSGNNAGSVSTIFTTITSDGETITSAIATTTIGGSNDSSESGSAAGAVVVTITGSDGSVVTSTLRGGADASETATASVTSVVTATESDSATGTEDSDATGTDGTDGSDSTDGGDAAAGEDDGSGAMAAVIPGLLAAVGLAAALL